MLRIKDLSISFGGLKAVENLNFTINRDEIVSLIGPNGAGKTTVLNCICRFYTPDSGEILFNNTNLLKLKDYQVPKAGISRSFQNLELFNSLTVTQNVLMSRIMRINTRISGFFKCAFNFKSCVAEEMKQKEYVDTILGFLGLTECRNEIVSNLPYGQQKMVELARALALEPKLLLLDEPAAGMNNTEVKSLVKLISRLKSEFSLTILLVEHNMSLVMSISDRICVLHHGRQLAVGSPKDIQSNPEVIKAYLGGGGKVVA